MLNSNVKFCVYASYYDNITKRDVVADEPTVQHLYGYIEQVVATLESELTHSNDEMARTVRIRMLTQTHALVKSGAYIEVTHFKHPLSNSWVRPDSRTQYIIYSVTSVFMQGTEIDVALIPKNKLANPVPKNADAPDTLQLVGYAD